MTRTLIRNFSFLTASNVLMPIASMALVVAISRIGGAEMLGEYSLLVGFFFIGQTTSTAGLHILLTRDIARAPERASAYFVAACAIGVVAAAATAVVLVPAFAAGVSQRHVTLGLIVMAASLLPTVAATFGESALLALGRAGDFVLIGVLESIGRTVIATSLVFVGYGTLAIAVNFLVFRALAALAIVAAMRRRGIALDMRVDRECARELRRQVPVVGSIPIVNALYWRVDTLLLSWIAGLADVGYYGASTRIFDITRSFPQAYSRAVYPVLAKLEKDDASGFRRLATASAVWTVAGTVPLALAAFGLAPWIVKTLYGPSLEPAALGLRIVAWVMVPYALTTTLAQVLFAAGLQAYDLRVNMIAMVTSAVANLALIPQFGFVGAAVASVISTSTHVAMQYRYVRKHVYDPEALGIFTRIAAATVVAVLTIVALRSRPPFVAVTAAIGCYGLGLCILGVLRPDHIRAGMRYVADLRRANRSQVHDPISPPETAAAGQ
jgi:O-antigen/teichoic acid export membrane protein